MIDNVDIMEKVKQFITSAAGSITSSGSSSSSPRQGTTAPAKMPSIKDIFALIFALLTLFSPLADAAPYSREARAARLSAKTKAGSGRQTPGPLCQMPDSESLREQLIKKAGPENFLTVAGGNAVHGYPTAGGPGVEGKTRSNNDLGQGDKCPTQINTKLGDPIEKRAICPWYYEINESRNRFPEFIPVAVGKCTSKSCIATGGDMRLACQPVMRTVTVLEKKGCADGLYTFKPVDIEIAVASVCAGKFIQDTVAATTVSPGAYTTDSGAPDYDQ